MSPREALAQRRSELGPFLLFYGLCLTVVGPGTGLAIHLLATGSPT